MTRRRLSPARLALLALALVLAALAAACSGSPVITTFPPGLSPREASSATWPAAEPDEPYPERFELALGERDELYFGELRGYLHAPLAEVVRALGNPDVVTNRRKLSAYSSTMNAEPGYELSFVSHSTVESLITVEFDVTWRQGGIREGDELVGWICAYQKTAGTPYISVLQGNLLLRALGPERTSIEIVSELQAVQTSTADLEQQLQDLYASVREVAHGRPMPVYE